MSETCFAELHHLNQSGQKHISTQVYLHARHRRVISRATPYSRGCSRRAIACFDALVPAARHKAPHSGSWGPRTSLAQDAARHWLATANRHAILCYRNPRKCPPQLVASQISPHHGSQHASRCHGFDKGGFKSYGLVSPSISKRKGKNVAVQNHPKCCKWKK